MLQWPKFGWFPPLSNICSYAIATCTFVTKTHFSLINRNDPLIHCCLTTHRFIYCVYFRLDTMKILNGVILLNKQDLGINLKLEVLVWIYINSLWPSDAIWWQGSRSTLVHVMAWCLAAPSHYLNQCWLIINKVQWCSSEGNLAWGITAISH